MTKAEANECGKSLCPVEYDGIVYAYIQKIEYDFIVKRTRLQLYDKGSHSIMNVPIEDVKVSTPEAYAEFRESCRKRHDALEQLFDEHRAERKGS